jgi:hypothetical protein
MDDQLTPSARAAVQRLAYSIDEALQAVPIGRSKLFELMASGQLRTITIGSRRLIPVDALAELASGGAA